MIDREMVMKLARDADKAAGNDLRDQAWRETRDMHFAAAVTQKAAEAEREACAQVAMLVASNGIETSAAIRARGTEVHLIDTSLKSVDFP